MFQKNGGKIYSLRKRTLAEHIICLANMETLHNAILDATSIMQLHFLILQILFLLVLNVKCSPRLNLLEDTHLYSICNNKQICTTTTGY